MTARVPAAFYGDRRVASVWEFWTNSDGQPVVGFDLADGGARVEHLDDVTVQVVSEDVREVAT